MKKILSLSLLLLLLVPARAQKYDGVIEKSVALIGNDIVMLSDIEAEAQMQRARGLTVDKSARCEILEGFLVSKLFLTQAKLDSLVVNDAQVSAMLDQRMNEILTTLGGEQKTEEYFGKPLYKLRQEWQQTLSDQSLIQEMQRNVASNTPKLTPRDIKKYVEETPAEDLPMVSTKYRIRQIGIYPDREAAELAVKEQLIGLRERVVNGEKFSTLARLYSEDPGSMSKGGELGMASRSIFWPAFSDAAMALKVGQVSQVVETPDGFHIIQLIERDGDMFNARHILIKPKYTSTDRTRAFSKLDSIRNLVVADSMSTRLASSSITVTSFASARSIFARWEPTSPAPSMTIFIASQMFKYLLSPQGGLQQDADPGIARRRGARHGCGARGRLLPQLPVFPVRIPDGAGVGRLS